MLDAVEADGYNPSPGWRDILFEPEDAPMHNVAPTLSAHDDPGDGVARGRGPRIDPRGHCNREPHPRGQGLGRAHRARRYRLTQRVVTKGDCRFSDILAATRVSGLVPRLLAVVEKHGHRRGLRQQEIAVGDLNVVVIEHILHAAHLLNGRKLIGIHNNLTKLLALRIDGERPVVADPAPLAVTVASV